MFYSSFSKSSSTGKQDAPFVDDLLLLLVWLDKPLADADEAAVHEAALQQVVNGFEQECPALIGQAAFPLAILLTWKDTQISASSTTLPNVSEQYERQWRIPIWLCRVDDFRQDTPG